MSSRMWTNVCFRFNDGDGSVDLNDLNTEIRNRLMREGSYMVSRSNVGENVVIRMVVANQNLTRATLDGLLERVVHHGEEILRGSPQWFEHTDVYGARSSPRGHERPTTCQDRPVRRTPCP